MIVKYAAWLAAGDCGYSTAAEARKYMPRMYCKAFLTHLERLCATRTK